MKTFAPVVLLASLACATSVSGQAQIQAPHSANASLTSEEKTMNTAEKIRQLKPATNLVELMQLLRTVHEQVLLIDPSFMEDANILRLFGPGTIEEKKPPSGRQIFKTFSPKEGNPFQFLIRISGTKLPPGYGSIWIRGPSDQLPFNYELIENHLLPGVQGVDPFGPLQPMTNEMRNLAGGRPLATHPKGYLHYIDLKRTVDHRSRMDVRLTRNAEVLDIGLSQDEEQK